MCPVCIFLAPCVHLSSLLGVCGFAWNGLADSVRLIATKCEVKIDELALQTQYILESWVRQGRDGDSERV